MEDGYGLMALYPPLRNSDHFEASIDRFACIVRFGMNESLSINDRTYDVPMQGIPQLTETEIANIYNFIQSSWYPDLPVLTESDIFQQLDSCAKNRLLNVNE